MKPQLEKIWKRNALAVMNVIPALADAKSALSRQMIDLLQQEPVFGVIEDGFLQAFMEIRTRNVAWRSTPSNNNSTKTLRS